LTKIKASWVGLAIIQAMQPLIYRCPRTGINVPVPFALETPAADNADVYEQVACPACLHLHLVCKSTGKLLGDKKPLT